MRENRPSGSMSRVGKRPVLSWSPVAACGDRFVDRVRTAPDFDSTERDSRTIRAYQRRLRTDHASPGHLDATPLRAMRGWFLMRLPPCVNPSRENGHRYVSPDYSRSF